MFPSAVSNLLVSSLYSITNQIVDPDGPMVIISPLDPRFAGSIPTEVDGFFQSVKILNMTSFGREVKP